jgi:hypothetical protein
MKSFLLSSFNDKSTMQSWDERASPSKSQSGHFDTKPPKHDSDAIDPSDSGHLLTYLPPSRCNIRLATCSRVFGYRWIDVLQAKTTSGSSRPYLKNRQLPGTVPQYMSTQNKNKWY